MQGSYLDGELKKNCYLLCELSFKLLIHIKHHSSFGKPLMGGVINLDPIDFENWIKADMNELIIASGTISH